MWKGLCESEVLLMGWNVVECIGMFVWERL